MKKWFGTTQQGNLQIKDREAFKTYLTTIQGDIELVVGKRKRGRSDAQNRYLWGVVYKLICQETGYRDEEIHELMLEKFAPRRFMELGGKSEKVVKRSSKMDKIEFSEYVESIKQWAAEVLSLYIPDPNECDLENINYY